MRRFSADYLEETRRGMWAEREALDALELSSRERILDVGCGTGELTGVFREESDADVLALDADTDLLRHVDADERLVGDATRLPLRDDVCDLVACQALLINLPDPVAAVREFSRVSADLVAAVEPNNAAVTVESTVASEPPLAARARDAYIEGVETNVSLGADAADCFEEAGLVDISTTQYEHVQAIQPPYGEAALEAAARKATGERLAEQQPTLAAGGLSSDAYDALRTEWREMGREVVAQMRENDYERVETVPFYVTVGRVPE
ncbi:class I SAM-dependent methyltransferase [Halobacterium sp. KA-6]|uniref:class I SAM-dependent methyltransferase n=1 Tax=Halobacterium sp. KA-6 TaxID=2896368 RepID=UPI001E4BDD2B|nr:methyltransferase domain-containing protein [Halobacterium sp. KA-6]MCD2201929.1 methyltransferase domain-containing protein [Halobacterium sp. KA-6]